MKKQNNRKVLTVRTMAFCALLAALSIALARIPGISIPMPTGDRCALDKFPILISGVLFGPVAGCLTGIVADTIGAVMFSPFGFNPAYCIIPILYGLSGGFFRYLISGKHAVLWIILAYIPPIVLGSILSYALIRTITAGGPFAATYVSFLSMQSIKYAIVGPLEILITSLLFGSQAFRRIGIQPPKPMKKKEDSI